MLADTRKMVSEMRQVSAVTRGERMIEDAEGRMISHRGWGVLADMGVGAGMFSDMGGVSRHGREVLAHTREW